VNLTGVILLRAHKDVTVIARLDRAIQ